MGTTARNIMECGYPARAAVNLGSVVASVNDKGTSQTGRVAELDDMLTLIHLVVSRPDFRVGCVATLAEVDAHIIEKLKEWG